MHYTRKGIHGITSKTSLLKLLIHPTFFSKHVNFSLNKKKLNARDYLSFELEMT